MKIVAIAGALALSMAGSLTWAKAADPMDDMFASKASVGNTFEIVTSRLALQRASSPGVMAFARMMIADHTKAQATLDTLAGPSGAEAGPGLDPDHQAMVDKLAGLSGADFDKAYAEEQIAAHQESADLLTGYLTQGQDPSLRGYASATLPVVNMHLRRIQAISAM